MATRKIKDAKDLSTQELIYFKGHAKATFMSDGATVEDAVRAVENATYKNKGYFPTLAELQSAFPKGSAGSRAYVGSTYPYSIYLWQNGAWVDSGATGGDESVDLASYYTKSETDTKLTELSAEINKTFFEEGYLNDLTGEELYDASVSRTNYIPCLKGDVIEGYLYRIHIYDKNYNYIKVLRGATEGWELENYTIQDDCSYVRLVCRNTRLLIPKVNGVDARFLANNALWDVAEKIVPLYNLENRVNVSLIGGDGNVKPNLITATKTLDLGIDPILLIGNTQYQMAALHSDAAKYRAISLSHESGTSAIKLVFNITSCEFYTKAYYEDLVDDEVLIGGIRWTWDGRILVDLPFPFTTNGRNEWDSFGAFVSLITEYNGALPNVNTTTRTLDLGDDPILIVGERTFSLKMEQSDPSKYRSIPLLESSTWSSAIKVVFNTATIEFYCKAWNEELSINEVVIGGVRWAQIQRFNFPFEYTIDGKQLWEMSSGGNEIDTLRKEINVSLISGSSVGGKKPNIDINSRILDLGDDPILLIGNTSYQMAALHSDVNQYKAISLNHESGTSAIKLVFNLESKKIYTIAWNEDLSINEVLVGGIRWAWGNNTLFNFPFEYTINGKEQWEDAVAKGGIVKQLRSKTGMEFVAHRGLHLNGIPENSLDAYRYASRCGYKYAETDFQVTSDGELVLMHNESINATMRNAADYSEITGTINVREHTLADLRKNYVLASDDVRYRRPIPTLEEFLMTCREYHIFPLLEVKNFGMTNDDIKKSFDLSCSILGDGNFGYTAFSFENMDYVRSLSPNIVVCYVDAGAGIVGTTNSITNENRCSKNTWWNPTWDNANYGGTPITREQVSAHRLEGVKVCVWTTPPMKFDELLKMGVDALLTDDICPSIDGLVGKVATSDKGFSDFTTDGVENNRKLILSAGQTCRFNAGEMWLGGYYLSIIGKGNFTISAPNLNTTINNGKTDRYIYQGMVDNKVGELTITANGNTELEFVEFSCVEF